MRLCCGYLKTFEHDFSTPLGAVETSMQFRRNALRSTRGISYGARISCQLLGDEETTRHGTIHRSHTIVAPGCIVQSGTNAPDRGGRAPYLTPSLPAPFSDGQFVFVGDAAGLRGTHMVQISSASESLRRARGKFVDAPPVTSGGRRNKWRAQSEGSINGHLVS